MKVWAQVNLGHTGGYWFMCVCRAHPAITAWAEAPTNPKYSPPAMLAGESFTEYIERERQRGEIESLGFIKSGQVVEYCAEHGRVARFIRHPVEVVGKKTSQYWNSIVRPGSNTPDLTFHVEQVEQKIGRPMRTEEDHFEGYTRILAGLYHWLVNKLPREWPLVKLETFDRSIGTDGLYFRRVMEYLTQVEWPDGLACMVRDVMLPNPPFVEGEPLTRHPHDQWKIHGWLYDPLPRLRWQNWTRKRRDFFLSHFEDIMLRIGYGWPNV